VTDPDIPGLLASNEPMPAGTPPAKAAPLAFWGSRLQLGAAAFWLLAVLAVVLAFTEERWIRLGAALAWAVGGALMWSDSRSAAVAPGGRGRAVLPLLGHFVAEMVLIFAGVVLLVV